MAGFIKINAPEIDSQERARARTLLQFRNSPVFQQILQALISEVQALQDAIKGVIELRGPADAAGENLNVLGRIVGQERELIDYSEIGWFAFDQSEGGTTNYLLYSEIFKHPTWFKERAYVLSNITLAPNGIQSADKIVEDLTASNTHRVAQVLGSNSGKMVAFIHAKKAERKYVSLVLYNTTDGSFASAIFNLDTGVVAQVLAGEAVIEPSSNGFFRCFLFGNSTVGGSSFYIQICNDFPTPLYTGDGVSGLYIWGAQLEYAAAPSSYVPSIDSFVSRASEKNYIDDLDQYQTAAIDEAVYLDDSLFYEDSSANRLTDTEDFVKWTSGAAVVLPNTWIAPDGTLTGDTVLDFDNVNYLSKVYSTTKIAEVYTASIFVKKDSTPRATRFPMFRITFLTGGVANSADFKLDTSTGEFSLVGSSVGINGSVIEETAEYYRVALTATDADPLNTVATLTIFPAVGASTTWINSPTTVGSVDMWGAQLEPLPFATSYMPSVETFTSRASTATYYDSAGILQTATIDEERITYNPADLTALPAQLFEEASTNLVTYSEQFNDVSWLKIYVSISANAATAPNGTLTADRMTETVDLGAHQIYKTISPFTAGSPLCSSIFVEPDTRDIVELVISSGVNFILARFNLATKTFSFAQSSAGAVIYSSPIELLPGGRVRLSLSGTLPTVTTANATFRLNNGVSPSYTGDGVSGVYIWGFQFELSRYATSYIPTVTTAVTRAADVYTSTPGARAADILSSVMGYRLPDYTASPSTAVDVAPAWVEGAPLFSSLEADDELYRTLIGAKIFRNFCKYGSVPEVVQMVQSVFGIDVGFIRTGLMQVAVVVPNNISTWALNSILRLDSNPRVDDRPFLPYPATLEITNALYYVPNQEAFIADVGDGHQIDVGKASVFQTF